MEYSSTAYMTPIIGFMCLFSRVVAYENREPNINLSFLCHLHSQITQVAQFEGVFLGRLALRAYCMA